MARFGLGVVSEVGLLLPHAYIASQLGTFCRCFQLLLLDDKDADLQVHSGGWKEVVEDYNRILSSPPMLLPVTQERIG